MEKQKNIKIILIISIVLLLVLALVIVLIWPKNDEKPIIIDNKDTYVVDSELAKISKLSSVEDFYTYKLFTDYETYKDYFGVDSLSFESFIDNNYVVISLVYDNCGESEAIPTNHIINGNTIVITEYYNARCGLCAPLYDYYLLKIDKSLTDVDVKIDSIARNEVECNPNVAYKPIIYLYPEKQMNVNIKLINNENITISYPKYNNGWNVIANPDGTLYDSKTNREYYALFWEGKNFYSEVSNDGFVISGKDTAEFLEEKLKILGLNDKESNEFIIYWLPKLERNNYNYIKFISIDEYMPIEITPKPDSLIRVYMVYKPLISPINVSEQTLERVNRNGFVVVEWGGSEID